MFLFLDQCAWIVSAQKFCLTKLLHKFIQFQSTCTNPLWHYCINDKTRLHLAFFSETIWEKSRMPVIQLIYYLLIQRCSNFRQNLSYILWEKIEHWKLGSQSNSLTFYCFHYRFLTKKKKKGNWSFERNQYERNCKFSFLIRLYLDTTFLQYTHWFTHTTHIMIYIYWVGQKKCTQILIYSFL